MNDKEISPAAKALMEKRLSEASAKLKIIDRMLIFLMARRNSQAMKVAQAKHPNGAPTVRSTTEDDRIKDAGVWADEEGINPHFARSLLYFIIDESCKEQSKYRENTPLDQDIDYSLRALRENLLKLTEEWASIYDKKYEHEVQVKKNHLNFEHTMLNELVDTLPEYERGLIIDIGCATGRETFLHAKSFNQVIGYDVSPHMIAQAKANAAKEHGKKAKVEFVVHDIETGIPLADNSASCVYMNHGTASDIANIRHVILEIRRVLRTGGVFFLSFYNANALMNQTYLPWPPILGCEVNLEGHFNEVACGKKVLPVFAQAYTTEQAHALLPSHMVLRSTMTHPTVSSILPKNFFRETTQFDKLEDLDQKLVNADLGAYIIISGQKT